MDEVGQVQLKQGVIINILNSKVNSNHSSFDGYALSLPPASGRARARELAASATTTKLLTPVLLGQLHADG